MIVLLGNRPAHDREAVERIRRWTRELLALDDSVVVVVTQLTCPEEECPDVETVVGVLQPGTARKFAVPKALGDVTRGDLAEAVSQPSGAVELSES